jgi:hypothetical protein
MRVSPSKPFEFRGPAPIFEPLVVAMSRFLRNNGLSLVMFALFFIFLGGQSLAGWKHYNESQRQHGEEAVGWGEYVTTGEFIESVFENWESEFLQMAAFILLSALLVQRGAAESKKPDPKDSERDSNIVAGPDSPEPVRRGGLWLKV